MNMQLQPDVIASLEAMPEAFAALYARFPAAALRWEPPKWDGMPGETFCAADQACHIRDIEIDGYQARIRRVLSETYPELTSFDSYALARERDYVRKDPIEALRQFKAGRVETLRLIAGLSGVQFERRAQFGEYGDVTLAGLIHFLCSHDQQHLACMHWLLGKWHSRA